MKKVTSLIVLIFLLQFISCSKDDTVVNTPPKIEAQSFTVSEDASDTFTIGTVKATDVDKDNLSFTLKTDTSDLFEITSEGALSLQNGKSLDYETTTSYTLSVEVSDGTDKASASITVIVTDVDENTAPIINAQTFTVAEDISDTVEIGAVVATDAENNTLSFSITTNDNGLFEITSEGKLSLVNGKNLDYETATSHTITVEVNDGSLTGSNTITINVTDVNEVPTTGAFITTWETTTPNEEILIQIRPAYTYDFTIDWGDGTIESNQVGTKSHTYANAGVHTVKISGTFPAMFTPGAKLKSIEQWGTQEWKSMASFFYQASNLVYNATDTPDLTKVTNMRQMFLGVQKFNADLSNWDVSNVTDMSAMFALAKNFNGNISNWNVSSVTNMNNMFFRAEKFNGDISSWNVSNVTNMNSMFREASSFNQNIGSWNVGKVKNMGNMFRQATIFNQDLNSWDMSNVEIVDGMFLLAESFNGNIADWNVSNITGCSNMFAFAKSFNQDLNNWKLDKVINLRAMFQNAESFNGNIGNWDVSKVVNMDQMFNNAKNFNQDLNNWDVSNVRSMIAIFQNAEKFNGNISNWKFSTLFQSMREMFSGATAFNGNIGNWDVSKITNMDGMFNGATNFSQDLGSWDISRVNHMQNMFTNSGMSTNKNYTKTLIGWSKLSTVLSSVTLGASNITYCTNYSADAATARDFLINTKGWNITGDTVSNSCL